MINLGELPFFSPQWLTGNGSQKFLTNFALVDREIVLAHMGMIFWHFLFFWQFVIYFMLGFALYIFQNNSVVQFGLFGLVTMYIGFYIFDTRHYSGGQEIPSFVESFICQYPSKWFPMEIIKTAEIPSDKQYTFGLHPHGLMPWGLFPVGRTKQWTSLFPDIKIRCLAADALFKIPIAREATMFAGGVSCAQNSARHVLQQGLSIGVMPGGCEEMLYSEPEEETIVIKKRKGFVRLAIENGSDIVPCYCFGVTDLYNQIKFYKDLRLWLLKKTRVGVTFGWGRYFYNILPEKRNVSIVVGEPIHVEKCEHPTEEMVDKYHQQYIDNLVKLYNDYKGQMPGYEKRELVVM